MEERINENSEVMAGENNLAEAPAKNEQFDPRRQAYEDAKQGIQDFEQNHPGTVRKVVCTTVLGALVTAAIDTVIVLTA